MTGTITAKASLVGLKGYLLQEEGSIKRPGPPLAGVNRVVAATRRVVTVYSSHGSLSNVLWIAQGGGTEHTDGHFTSIYGAAPE